MASFGKMFLGQLIMMMLVTWNFQMISKQNVPMVLTSESIWALANFWYVKKLIKDETVGGWLGYSLGCVLGTTSSVCIVKYGLSWL